MRFFNILLNLLRWEAHRRHFIWLEKTKKLKCAKWKDSRIRSPAVGELLIALAAGLVEIVPPIFTSIRVLDQRRPISLFTFGVFAFSPRASLHFEAFDQSQLLAS